jgi:outer membrane protein assembly factor BamB
MSKCVVVLLASVVFTSAAQGAGAAEDSLAWPQFHGPGGSGVAHDQKPPIEIGPDKNVKWKVPAPNGLSSPIAAGDKLVITAFDNGKLYTIAYNRADGAEAWRAEALAQKIEPFNQSEGSPAASTPATDGQRIVSYFGSCGLYCYDLSGKQLWKREMPSVETLGNFGSGVSPIIADNFVVLVRDEPKDPKIIALDAATGDVKWERKRDTKVSYSTPAVWSTPAGKQIAAPGASRMIGYDLKSGEEKWHVQGMPAASCASPLTSDGVLYFAAWSPGASDDKEFQMPDYDKLLKGEGGDADGDGVLSRAEAQKSQIKDFFDNQDANHDGKLTREEWQMMLDFLAAGKNSAFALKPGGAGDVTKTHILWQKTKGLPYVPSAIVYDGQCLMVKDGGVVTAYDAKTGDELYQKRAVASGNYYASPVAANGHIYFASQTDGTVTVLKSGSPTPKVVAKNPPLGERLSATPAIADDTLYVRTAGHLYAFAETK